MFDRSMSFRLAVYWDCQIAAVQNRHFELQQILVNLVSSESYFINKHSVMYSMKLNFTLPRIKF